MRGLRYFLYFFCSIAVLFFIIILSFYLIVTPRYVKNKIDQHLQQFCNAQIIWHGEVRLQKLPILLIQLPTITVQHPTGDITIKNGIVEMMPWNIFTRAPKIEQLILDRVQVNLTAQDPLPISQENIGSKFLYIKHWKITNGQTNLQDYTLKNINIEGTNLTETGTSWQGKAQLIQKDNTLSLSGWGELGFQQETITLRNTKVKCNGLLQHTNLQGRLQIQEILPTQPNRWEAQQLQFTGLVQQWPITVHAPQVSLTKTHLQVPSLQLTVQNQDKGRFSISSHLQWNLAQNDLILQELSIQNNKDSNYLTGQVHMRAGKVYECDVQGIFAHTSLSFQTQSLHDFHHSTLTLGTITPEFLQFIPYVYPVLKNINGVWKFTLTNGLPSLQINNLRGEAYSKDQRFVWHLLPNTDFLGNGSLQKDGTWSYQLQIKKALLQELIPTQLPITGTFSGKGVFSGHLLQPDTHAQWSLESSAGALQGIDLYLAENILVSEYPDRLPYEVLRSEGKTPFHRIQLTIQTTQNNHMTFQGSISGASWQGEITGDTASQQIQIPLQWHIQGNTKKILWPLSLHLKENENWHWALQWDVIHQNSQRFIHLDPWSLTYWENRISRWYQHLFQTMSWQRWLQKNTPWPEWLPWDKPEFLQPQ